MEGIAQFLFAVFFLTAVALVKPTISFVGSFATPCKQSFYNSDTLFEASRDCILRKVD